MLSNIKDYLVDLGLAVSHDKIKNSIQEKQVRERLEGFIQREGKYNYLCTTEEEVDFENSSFGSGREEIWTDYAEDLDYDQ